MFITLQRLSNANQLIRYFMAIFFCYFSLKNKSVAMLCIGFLRKTIKKILALKFTRLINPHYLKTFTFLLFLSFMGQLQAQNCEQFGLVSKGFLLGKFDCDVLIVSSDGAEIFQPLELTDELTPGKLIRFSYDILDSTDCADNVPLINITCLEPFFESNDSILTTCNLAIESTLLEDSMESATAFQLEVFNQTDFGPYRPQNVQWYVYETGKVIGTTPIIEFSPSPNSPPSINICADVVINFPNGDNCETTLCHTIITDTIIPQADICQALFIYQPEDQLADNGTINFYNLSFGDYTQVLWDFGDGQRDTTSATNFTHTYNSPGLYEVCLTLEGDQSSCPSTFCLPIFTVGGEDICSYNDCVLPGDTNKDGTVNIFDALNIGVGFNTIGEVRPNAVIEPILQAAFDWDFATIFDLNFKHIDCDGNGAVNEQDYLAIDQNYQKITTQTTFQPNDTYADVAITFPAEEIVVNPNQAEIKIPANLIIGSTNKPIKNFYGAAISFNYDKTLIKEVETSYNSSSFVGIEEALFVREKLVQEDAQIGLAITRTDQEEVSGEGDIAEFAFIIDLDLIEGRSETLIELDINDIKIVDSNGEEIPVNVSDDGPKVTVIFDKTLSVNTTEQLTETQFEIYPNPVQETLIIDLAKTIDLTNSHIQIFNTLGQTTLTQSITNRQTKLNVSTMKNGVYWVKISTDQGIAIKEIFIE